ncbi:uncharacterized protein LOC111777023 [Cucurbita pepo subsp. pepo]|uniref:uncharacterized protein LOC111777023 n=1 Tax=Cucurbita pepo subsp. pepo TaxID=3664 RepID=UPI000C9D8C56|nr:uncharacterized protein LOC111777023 [Cucurbita pepo subsp. pepo]
MTVTNTTIPTAITATTTITTTNPTISKDHIFKYDPPNSTTPAHSVYQLPNMRSFVNCDLGKAKMLANSTQGSTENGFEFELKHQNPYYFACGEANGFHCQTGSMKFTLTPILQG